MGSFLRPTELDAALGALASGGPGGAPWVIVAGATDHYPARVGRTLVEDVLDVTAIASLRGVTEVNGGRRIGAPTTWTGVVETRHAPLLDALKATSLAGRGLPIQA